MVRRVPADAATTKPAVKEADQLAGMIVTVGRLATVMGQAMTRVRRIAADRAVRAPTTGVVPGVTDPIRIAPRSAAAHIALGLDQPGNRAASLAPRGWSFPRIWIFNSFRAACERSCAA